MRTWRIDPPGPKDFDRDDGYWYISCDWESVGRADTAEAAQFIVDACNAAERLKNMQGKMERWAAPIFDDPTNDRVSLES